MLVPQNAEIAKFITGPITISLKRPRSFIFHFALLGFSTRHIKSDFLPRDTAAIYPYPISSIPVQKLDIALHSEFLENIIE